MVLFSRAIVYILTFIATICSFSCSGETVSDFPKAEKEAKTLLLTDVPEDGSVLTLISMQGLLSNLSETNLLFNAGNCEKWLPYTGSELKTSQADGKKWDLKALLNEFARFFDGYILCDEESAAAALTLAKQKNSIVVTPEYEETVREAGLKKTMDATGWSELKLRFSREFGEIRRDVAFEQPTSFAPRLLDYAVMSGAYIHYDAKDSEKEHTNFFRFLQNNALVFGWNNDVGEYGTLSSFSKLNACLIPADHAYNLSVLSGYECEKLTQKTAVNAEEGKRTVCIMMSDGDNLQWFLGSYDDASHYGSDIRGSFPFSWGVPACAADIAAPVTQKYYEEMDKNDAFVLSLSGMGYTFPSKWKSSRALEAMAGKLKEKMEKLDTLELLVLDDGGFDSKAVDTLIEKTGASGIFYIDYSNYAGLEGKTRFVDGKPVVSAKYMLWAGIEGCSPEETAAKINALPSDPDDPGSYAFIIVHAWSGINESGEFAEGGDTMKAVQRLVQNLDENTVLTTPHQFIERIAGLSDS